MGTCAGPPDIDGSLRAASFVAGTQIASIRQASRQRAGTIAYGRITREGPDMHLRPFRSCKASPRRGSRLPARTSRPARQEASMTVRSCCPAIKLIIIERHYLEDKPGLVASEPM